MASCVSHSAELGDEYSLKISDQIVDGGMCCDVSVGYTHELAADEEDATCVTPEESISQEDTSVVVSVESGLTLRHPSLANYPVYEYERIRNKNIAEREALFKLLNPSFTDELKGPKVTSKRKKAACKITNPAPVRQSGRIQNKQSNVKEGSEGRSICSGGDTGDHEISESCAFIDASHDSEERQFEGSSSGDNCQNQDVLDVAHDSVIAVHDSIASNNEDVSQAQLAEGKFACLPFSMKFG